MKKLFTALLATFALASVSTAAFAESDQPDCKDFADFFDADELSRVIEQTASERITAANEFEHTNTGGYKSYSVYPDILKGLSNGTPLEELLPDEYCWMIPSDDDYLAKVILNNGVWEIIGRSKPVQELMNPDGSNDPTVRFDKINAAIEKIGLSDPTEVTNVVCLYIYEYAGSFVCITTEDNDYLVPFSSRPDFTKLTNGELYSLSEAYEILVQSFGEYEPLVSDGKKTEGYTLEEIKENLRINGFGQSLAAANNTDVQYNAKAPTASLLITIIPAAAVAIVITVSLLIWSKGSRKRTK